MPCVLIDSARLSSAASSKFVLGCIAPGTMRSKSTSDGSAPRSIVRSEDSSAPKPRPSAFRFIDNLPGQSRVGFGPFRISVVTDYWFAMAGSFGQPYVSWDYCLEHLKAVEVAQVRGDCCGEVCALIVHREQEAFDHQTGIV